MTTEIKKKRKFGPWSKEEKDYIAENANKLSIDDIAEQIDRDPESVNKYIRKTLGLRIQTKGRISTLSSGTDIENTLIWNELKKEFTDDELEVFIYHWNRIVIQFKEDVFPTEEMQIIDAIKLEIMMGRTLKSQKELKVKIDELTQEISNLKTNLNPESNGRLQSLEMQFAVQKGAFELTGKEFNDLLARKSNILKELKGTRDQRLKRIEDSKATFTGWMTEMVTNPIMRRELGLYIEKMRLAIYAEQDRLTKPFKYGDGEEDLPILTTEILEKLQAKEDAS